MRRLGKITMGLALFLLMSGGLLALTGWFMGGETSIEYNYGGRTIIVHPMGIRGSVRSGAYEAWSQESVIDVTAEDLGVFTGIVVDVPLADVVLQEGEGYSLAMHWNDERYAMEHAVEDGVLRVWSTKAGDYSFGWDDAWDHEATVTVTYPAGAALADVSVTAGMGDVQVYDLTAKKLVLDADMGSITLNGAQLDQAEFRVDMGQLEGWDLEVAGLTKATASMGSIDLSGTLRAMELECDMGDITIDTSLPESEYRYDLSVDMGTLTCGSTKATGGTLNGGSGTYAIQADCSMGSLEIIFD